MEARAPSLDIEKLHIKKILEEYVITAKNVADTARKISSALEKLVIYLNKNHPHLVDTPKTSDKADIDEKLIQQAIVVHNFIADFSTEISQIVVEPEKISKPLQDQKEEKEETDSQEEDLLDEYSQEEGSQNKILYRTKDGGKKRLTALNEKDLEYLFNIIYRFYRNPTNDTGEKIEDFEGVGITLLTCFVWYIIIYDQFRPIVASLVALAEESRPGLNSQIEKSELRPLVEKPKLELNADEIEALTTNLPLLMQRPSKLKEMFKQLNRLKDQFNLEEPQTDGDKIVKYFILIYSKLETLCINTNHTQSIIPSLPVEEKKRYMQPSRLSSLISFSMLSPVKKGKKSVDQEFDEKNRQAKEIFQTILRENLVTLLQLLKMRNPTNYLDRINICFRQLQVGFPAYFMALGYESTEPEKYAPYYELYNEFLKQVKACGYQVNYFDINGNIIERIRQGVAEKINSLPRDFSDELGAEVVKRAGKTKYTESKKGKEKAHEKRKTGQKGEAEIKEELIEIFIDKKEVDINFEETIMPLIEAGIQKYREEAGLRNHQRSCLALVWSSNDIGKKFKTLFNMASESATPDIHYLLVLYVLLKNPKDQHLKTKVFTEFFKLLRGKDSEFSLDTLRDTVWDLFVLKNMKVTNKLRIVPKAIDDAVQQIQGYIDTNVLPACFDTTMVPEKSRTYNKGRE